MLSSIISKIKILHKFFSLPVFLTLIFILIHVAIWWLLPSFEWREAKPFESVINRLLTSIFIALVAALAWGVVQKNKINHFEKQKEREELMHQDPDLLVLENQEQEFTKIIEMMKKNMDVANPLYLQPWYLVLGIENCGKSSFIQHSEQNFTFSSTLQASGFTHKNEWNFNWWVANDIVLIDPDGQLISQPVERARRQWLHFIHWIEKKRSQRPLNGIILTIDIESILNTNEDLFCAYAKSLRARLKEVMDTIESRLPVYVILTKIDLLQGFDSFFRYISKEKREELFGFSFSLQSPENADIWLQEFSNDYDKFIKNLNSHLNYDLANRVTEECQNIFIFTRQLTELKNRLNQFFILALQSDKFSTSSLVRGVYFTSVTQQNRTINLFENAISQHYNLPASLPLDRKPKNIFVFFTRYLFSDAILPESGLATDNLKAINHRRRLIRYSFVACSLISIGLILGWQHAYEENNLRADEVLTRVKQYADQPKLTTTPFSHQEMMDTLNIIREATFEFGFFREKTKIFSDMGLYQGHEIGPKVEQTYLNLLKTQFLPYLMNQVIIALNQSKTDEERLIHLRIYRMMTDQSGRQNDIVMKYFENIWQKNHSGNKEIQDTLYAHLNYAMQYTNLTQDSINGEQSAILALQPFHEAIAKAQAELNNISNEERVYKNVSHNAQNILGMPINLQQQVGPSFDFVFLDRYQDDKDFIISKFLTKEGFEKYFVPQINSVTELALIDNWVLGYTKALSFSDADKKAFQEKIRALYVAEYINKWQNSLSALDVQTANDINDSILITDSLLSNNAPMQRLLREVNENTNMYDISSKDEKAQEKLLSDPQYIMSLAIEAPFSGIHQLLSNNKDQTTNINEVLSIISELNNYLKSIKEAPDMGMSALEATQARIKLNNTDPIYKLKRVSRSLPSPIDRIVNKIANDSWKAVKQEAIKYLGIRWKEDIYDLFITNFSSRYPFLENGKKDVSLEDFSEFFAPNGVLDTFYKNQLKWLIEVDKNANEQDGMVINKKIITQIKQAEKIREAFFNQKGVLNVNFTLQPLRLSSNKRRSLLYIDGQQLSYSQGPKENIEMIWPNTFSKQASSKITLVPVKPNSSPRSLEVHGPWALFRLLKKGAVISASETSVDYQFRIDSGEMTYRLQSEEAINPFTDNIFASLTFSKSLY